MATVKPVGPLTAKLAIVSERPGFNELQKGEPFVGTSGDELDRMLIESGLVDLPREPGEDYWTWMRRVRNERRESLFITNVFHDAPNEGKGDLSSWCASKTTVVDEYEKELPLLQVEYPDFPWPRGYTWDNLGTGGAYLRPKYLRCLPRLKQELCQLSQCNIIIALGAVSCWALLGEAGIKSLRGVTTMGTLVPGVKVIPTFHPAFVQRFWQSRVVVLADLTKAKNQSKTKDLHIPPCTVWVNPTLEDLRVFDDMYLRDADLISVDIETKFEQVRCIGFAPNDEIAIVVPFQDLLKRGYSYWKNPEDEIAAWLWCAEVLSRPTAKLGQNYMFDFQYLLQKVGLPTRNVEHDTLLAHHALYPELDKGLGFLGSLYTSRPSWKNLRLRADSDDKED